MSGLIRACATALALAGLLGCALFLFANGAAGSFGLGVALETGTARIDVVAVARASAAERAGIRPGDAIVPASEALADRAAFYLFANPPLVAVGDRIRVIVRHDQAGRIVSMVATPDATAPPYEAAYFCTLAIPIGFIGWLIVWRRPRSSDAVTLGFSLLFFALWIATPDRFGSPLARLVMFEIFSSTCAVVAVGTGAVFFTRFPEGLGLARSRFRRWAFWASIVNSILGLGELIPFYLAPPYIGMLGWLTVPIIATFVAPVIAAALSCIDAFRHGDRSERTRLRWIGTSFFIGVAGPLVIPAATAILGPGFSILDQALLESTLFVLAIGLTYAILARRVVDVSFAVNRALVFSAVSALVISLFITIEWLVGTYLVTLSRATSYTVQLAVAVLIGFSLRPIHNRVDHLIDVTLFAKRYAAEAALRRLATEVSFVRDRASLLARVDHDLTTYLEVDRVCVYYRESTRGDFALLHANADAPAVVSADDDAAVALAAREDVVELHARRTTLSGEIAVPLAVRKRLVGILALGHKVTGEALAPDELDGLRFLAGYLAAALATSDERAVADETQALLTRIARVVERIEARLGE